MNISNIVASGGTGHICSMIAGIPGHRIEDVKISNILVQHPGGGTKKDAELQLPEKEKEYPEPTMFGTTPAHGMMVRHAAGIEVSDIKVITKSDDARPCFVLDDVEHADFYNIKSPHVAGAPAFVLNNVKDFNISRSKPLPDSDVPETKHKEI